MDDCNDMMVNLQKTNFIFRDKVRVSREVEFKPEEPIFFKSDGLKTLN